MGCLGEQGWRHILLQNKPGTAACVQEQGWERMRGRACRGSRDQQRRVLNGVRAGVLLNQGRLLFQQPCWELSRCSEHLPGQKYPKNKLEGERAMEIDY